MSLYVDGCSYFYGQYLDRKYSMGSLLSATTDKAEPGKSNISIIEDLYKNIDDHDIFIIGFTFSGRYTFEHLGKRFYAFPNRMIPNFGDYTGADSDEDSAKKLIDLYYYFSDLKTLDLRSDIYVDSAINLLERNNKKFVIISWENRNIKSKKIFYPRKFLKRDMLLKSDNHLNENGMIYLSNKIKEML